MTTVRILLLADGIGALVSAIMLGIVLPNFQPLVGMPLKELYILAAIPVVFSCSICIVTGTGQQVICCS